MSTSTSANDRGVYREARLLGARFECEVEKTGSALRTLWLHEKILAGVIIYESFHAGPAQYTGAGGCSIQNAQSFGARVGVYDFQDHRRLRDF
jgi:hypothetical protein